MILSEGNKLDQISLLALHQQLAQRFAWGETRHNTKHVLIVIGGKTFTPGAANKDTVVEGLSQKSDSGGNNQRRRLFAFYVLLFG